jgi:hypothetical protein
MLFAFGAGIVVLAFFLITDGQVRTREDGFMWISIAFSYLVFFVPFFFSVIRQGNFSSKIPSLALVWLGIFIYIPLSIGVIVLLKTAVLPFNAAIIIQAVLIFVFATNVYFGYFANAHTQSVAREEAELREYLSEIKQKAAVLSLTVNALPGGFEKAQATLRRALDDIKYLSPVQGFVGKEAEKAIILSLDSIKSLCVAATEGARPSSFDKDADRLLTLVRERKLLRN